MGNDRKEFMEKILFKGDLDEDLQNLNSYMKTLVKGISDSQADKIMVNNLISIQNVDQDKIRLAIDENNLRMGNFVVSIQKEFSSEIVKIFQSMFYNPMNKLNEQNVDIGGELSNIWEYINTNVYQEIKIAKNSVENLKKYLESSMINDYNQDKIKEYIDKEIKVLMNNMKENKEYQDIKIKEINQNFQVKLNKLNELNNELNSKIEKK